MTVRKDVTIWCDGIGCTAFFDAGIQYTHPARNAAIATGWIYHDGRDLCPVHAQAVIA